MSHKITNSTGLVINTHFWHMFQFLKSVGDSLEAVSQYARFFSLLRDAAADVYKLLRPNLQLRDQSSRCVPSLCKRDHCAFDHAIIALGGLRKCRPFTHCPSCPRLQDTHDGSDGKNVANVGIVQNSRKKMSKIQKNVQK